MGARLSRRLRSRLWAPAASFALGLAALAALWSALRSREAAPVCGGYEECLRLGRRLRREDRYARAERVYQRALRLSPKSFQAEFELGLLERARSRYDAAASHLRAAIALKPDEYDAYMKLAEVLMLEGRYVAERKVLENARKVAGTGWRQDAYVHLGYAGMYSGSPVESEAAFRSAIAVDSTSPLGYHHLGVYFYKHGRTREAESYFRKALSLFDRSSKGSLGDRLHAIDWLSVLLSSEGRFDEAASLIKGALAGEALRKGGLSRYARAMRLNLLMQLGDVYADKGEPRSAEVYYQRVIQAMKEDPASYDPGARVKFLIHLAEFYAGKGRHADAAKTMEEIEEYAMHAPSSQYASRDLQLGLAIFYARNGELSNAEKAWRRLIALSAKTPRSPALAEAEAGLGRVLRREGRLEEAQTMLSKSLAIFEADHWPKEAAEASQELEIVRQELSRRPQRQFPARRKISKELIRQARAHRT